MQSMCEPARHLVFGCEMKMFSYQLYVDLFFLFNFDCGAFI